MQSCWTWGVEHVRAGILVLAFGDISALEGLAERAARDGRDILIQLEQPKPPLTRSDLVERARNLGLRSLLFPESDKATVRAMCARNVKDFLAEELITPSDRLQPSTRLAEDLGVKGLAAIELLAKFGQRFGVDMTGFDPARHFEPSHQPTLLRSFLLRVGWLRPRPLATITVDDLVEAALRKAWLK